MIKQTRSRELGEFEGLEGGREDRGGRYKILKVKPTLLATKVLTPGALLMKVMCFGIQWNQVYSFSYILMT